MRPLISLFLLLVVCSAFSQKKTKLTPNKDAVLKSIEKHEKELVRLSDQIWAFAETALRENNSAKVLADYAEAQGFKVTREIGRAHV